MDIEGLKCIIIDDDPLITDLVQHFCSKIPQVDYCIACNSATDGLQLINNQLFDILFLDFNMPDLNGKGILELKQDNSKVIMITSHTDFAVDSYNYPEVIDYLLKPISFERFYKAIEKFQAIPDIAPKKEEKDLFYAKDGNKWIPVPIKDLIYIKSESNYVILYLVDKQVMSLMNLKDMENILPEHFLRIHRSYIINTKHIEYITSDELSINGKLLPVSAKYKSDLKALIEKF